MLSASVRPFSASKIEKPIYFCTGGWLVGWLVGRLVGWRFAQHVQTQTLQTDRTHSHVRTAVPHLTRTPRSAGCTVVAKELSLDTKLFFGENRSKIVALQRFRPNDTAAGTYAFTGNTAANTKGGRLPRYDNHVRRNSDAQGSMHRVRRSRQQSAVG